MDKLAQGHTVKWQRHVSWTREKTDFNQLPYGRFPPPWPTPDSISSQFRGAGSSSQSRLECYNLHVLGKAGLPHTPKPRHKSNKIWLWNEIDSYIENSVIFMNGELNFSVWWYLVPLWFFWMKVLRHFAAIHLCLLLKANESRTCTNIVRVDYSRKLAGFRNILLTEGWNS